MIIKQACQSCQNVCEKNGDISKHPSLITFYYAEEKESNEFLLFCTCCSSVLRLHLPQSEDMEGKAEWFNKQWTTKLEEFLALSLWAENRREYMENRIRFLRNKLLPLYEPIDEKELHVIKNAGNNVIRSPYFPHWHTSIEKALQELDNEEWEPSYSFSYADPLDLRYLYPTNKTPRYYRSYLVRADEVECLLQIELNEANRLSVWKQRLSQIEQVSIWDEQKKKHLSIEDFIQEAEIENLWMDVLTVEKERELSPYITWIRNKFNGNTSRNSHC